MRVRDIMTDDCQCVKTDQSLQDAAQMMRDLDVGSLPICGDDRLVGMLTDRDIVIKCVAEGDSPADCVAGDYAQGTPIWVNADAHCDQALSLMSEHAVKRLPVIDDKQLVGIVSEADIVQCVEAQKAGELATAIASADPNSGGEHLS